MQLFWHATINQRNVDHGYSHLARGIGVSVGRVVGCSVAAETRPCAA